MIIVTWWLINDESPDDPCIWSRGNLYPFFWCTWYLVSSFQICVGGSILWRHHDVIVDHKISLVYHVISLVPVSSHILNQTSFYKTMIGTFSVPYHVTQKCHMIETVTWFCHVTQWGHMIFRFILFWNVQIGRNSLVFQPIHVGVTSWNATLLQ